MIAGDLSMKQTRQRLRLLRVQAGANVAFLTLAQTDSTLTAIVPTIIKFTDVIYSLYYLTQDLLV